MGLFDFIGGLFGTGGGQDVYNVTQGLPGYMAGSNLAGLQSSQAGTQNAITQQQAFLNAINNQGGLNASQAGIFGQQQALANQFGQLASGQGPNPAQAQLAQNTGQNMQQQAAMMAGARGAQSNPGLIGREAAQVGGNIQQQAVGQAATMQAQQQLAGMQALAAQQGQMANLATAGVGQQQTALSQLGAQTQNYQQMMQQGLTSQNQQQLQAQMGQADLAKQGMSGGQGLVGGLLGGVAAGASKLLFAGGGTVPDSPTSIQQNTDNKLGKSILGQFASNMGTSFGGNGTSQGGPSAVFKGANSFGNALGTGLANAFTSTPLSATTPTPMGASDLNPGAMAQYASDGGEVGGKAKIKGDSEKNDTVPAMLSPGEVVIPRSHVNDPHKTAEFLNHLMGWNLRAG
jgi:hypothetical protein